MKSRRVSEAEHLTPLSAAAAAQMSSAVGGAWEPLSKASGRVFRQHHCGVHCSDVWVFSCVYLLCMDLFFVWFCAFFSFTDIFTMVVLGVAAAAAGAAEETAEAHPDSLLNHPTGQKAKGSSYDSEW
jgi:hypothetical protein